MTQTSMNLFQKLPIMVGNSFLYKGRLSDALPLILKHHYTKRRPGDPMETLLLIDGEAVIAAATFTSPVNRYFGKGSIELSRLVRTPECEVPMSAFIAGCMKHLKSARNKELKYCLSYADTTVGHHGGVYQASNFVFVSETKGSSMYVNSETGQIISGRSFDQHASGNKDGWERMRSGKKLLYVYPLNERKNKLLARFNWKELPYPKPFLRKGLDANS